WLGEGGGGFAGVAGGQSTGGDDLGDDPARPDHSARADGHAGQDGHVPADPDVVPDGDGLGLLKAAVPLGVAQGVVGGVHPAVGPDEAVLADGDLGAVHQVGAAVDIGTGADAAVIAVVGLKGGRDMGPFGGVGQNQLLQAGLFGGVAGVCVVESQAAGGRLVPLGAQLGVKIGVVPEAE